MKLLLEISEDEYNKIKQEKVPMGALEYLIKETATPLEYFIVDIEVEIEEARKEENIPHDLYPYSYKEGLDKAMSIIDKHVKESEE